MNTGSTCGTRPYRRPTARLRRSHGLLGALLCATGLLLTGQAQAADADPRARAAARELATRGVEAFEAGDYGSALERFDRAAALFSAPTVTIMQARTLAKLGRWVEALDRYAATIAMTTPHDAPEAFRKALSEAKVEAQALREQTPTLEVRVPNAAAPELDVRLDGHPIPRALLNVEQLVDPGAHTVSVLGASKRPFQRLVRLEPGERARIDLPTSGPVIPAARSDQSVATADPPRPVPSRPDRTWAFVALGAGALSSTVFAISGGLALSQHSKLEEVCRPGCPSSASEDLSAFRTSRTVASISSALAVTSIGIGTYLLISGKPEREHVALKFSPLPRSSGLALSGAF